MTIEECRAKEGVGIAEMPGLGLMPKWEKAFYISRGAIVKLKDTWAIATQLTSVERGREIVDDYLPVNYVKAKEEVELWRKQREELEKMGIPEMSMDEIAKIL